MNFQLKIMFWVRHRAPQEKSLRNQMGVTALQYRRMWHWGRKQQPENATPQCSGTPLYSQKLLALASPLHMFLRVSWSGVVPITATHPLLKSTKTPSRSQYTFLEGGLRRLESPPRATDGLSDIPDTGSVPSFQVFSYTFTEPILRQQYCCVAVLRYTT